MSPTIFDAISCQDLETLEQSLKNGISPITVNEEGISPLALVASLIQKSFDDANYNEENMYKQMAAMLIVNGAPEDELYQYCGEVSNLSRYICDYIIDISLQRQDSRKVAELIAAKRLWFENNADELEAAFLEAIQRGDKGKVDAMLENDKVHYAYEQ